ncbi:MAG: pilus assembly PilX N-terminal domain-containing protein [Phycisphaerae bacterium]|nr:pilus assembly PilX N-terminal domain-containing protein [Phycisphaerae bacterium]
MDVDFSGLGGVVMWRHNNTKARRYGNTKTRCRTAARLQPTAYSLQPERKGFVLLMVLIIVTVSSLVGITYMTVSTLQASASSNLMQASRAKYLAESALEHGVYLLHSDPGELAGTSALAPLGPFYLDDSDDSYVLWAERTGEVGMWLVTGQGHVGEAASAVSARIFLGPGVDVTGGHTAVSGGVVNRISSAAKIFGHVAVTGGLENFGTIEGDITYAGSVFDAGNHRGAVIEATLEEIPSPQIDWSDYVAYRMDGVTYAAARVSGSLTSGSSLIKGHAATANNPAGVVVIEAGRGACTIGADTEFIGTIVVNGNLLIDGANITLKAQPGFPAIVCSGAIYVTNATDLAVTGMVVAVNGIRPYSGSAPTSKTIIHGPLITQDRIYDDQLLGTHELHSNASAGQLYDVKTGVNATGTIRVLDWYDR